MKSIYLIFIILGILSISMCVQIEQKNLPDSAETYCENQGYQYELRNGTGVCISGDKVCDASDYYNNLCSFEPEQNQEETEHSVDVKEVCPNFKFIEAELTELHDNPYVRGGGNYIHLLLPQSVIDSHLIVNDYNVNYPTGGRIFCINTDVIDTVYKFECLEWYIWSENVDDNGNKIKYAKKVKITLDIDLDISGFRSDINSIKYTGSICRDVASE